MKTAHQTTFQVELIHLRRKLKTARSKYCSGSDPSWHRASSANIYEHELCSKTKEKENIVLHTH